LNEGFFTLMRKGRPFVLLKAALSQDGCMAAAPGTRTQLTAAAADRHVHVVRAEVDAIGVGVGTILADDPQLTARGAYRERPFIRVVFDRSLRTPPDAQLLSTLSAGPVIIVTTEEGAQSASRRALEAAGAAIEIAADRSVGAALRALGAREIGSLLLEGGAKMHGAAWDEGVVDFVSVYMTPHVLGDKGVKFLDGRPFDTASLLERHVERLGPDVLIEGYVHRPC
jgi:diaminohydroxyphosphoribosylaminopyrimidine deaminase/5-amino-6-(5-phosphoribosylamino)uracil reductase